ncbi:MAG: 2-oxo-4-hydroxy-4-carboxy-5-ureidoimidazoline decarboxylase [Candidatus Eisenbacteria bacterium]|uniref:2-oxo-4-hydroxy-4-carboxy-5-ureidoimidazoline decarboxylase n=1 Tax=Eiseniibacteriota bacterium TaxID=2212470 RepID=A0A849SCZ2_UNCEI|nr:2-oxo-4-hydroxy-4-carboxy-5-ureidoimidazoline decarboxylase [Candidatus Eisenbacteria bacterium]
MTLEQLSALPPAELAAQFERCCGARRWVRMMCMGRPFRSLEALHEASDRASDSLTPTDWREAFTHHPRIGDVAALREKFATTSVWAGAEQAGAAAASEATLHALAQGNREYEQRFGYLFIVCATGRSADEMLSMLSMRLGNAASEEFTIAIEEQRKIMRLRLDKMIEKGTS